MYFHVAPDIYLSYYNEEIIVLDLRKDRYLVLQPEVATLLVTVLTHEFSKAGTTYSIVDFSQDLPQDFNETLQALREMRIVDKHDFDERGSLVLHKKEPTAGVENVDWRMPYGDLHIKVPKKIVLEAYYLRVKVELVLKFRGFAVLIRMVKRARNPKRTYSSISADEYNRLATALNRACFYYPSKTKCLEWASTLTLLALKRGWQCNLVIGVQNMPFLAHAWVEANDMVVADTQNLPKDLGVILSEPFKNQQSQQNP